MLEKDPGEFSNFCKHQNFSIDDWIGGIISGPKKYVH